MNTNTETQDATTLIANVQGKFTPDISFAGITSGSILGSVERVHTPMISREGKRSFFQNIVKLLWLNEQNEVVETYGCLVCGHQAINRQVIGHHIGRIHNNKSGRHIKGKKEVEAKQNTPEDLATLLSTMIAEYKEQAEMWEKRAKVAEKKLSKLAGIEKRAKVAEKKLSVLQSVFGGVGE